MSELHGSPLRTIATLPFQIIIDILLHGGELLSDEEHILRNQQTLTFILSRIYSIYIYISVVVT
jgi:hypothetical protein